jgi:hypothetical protein
MRDFFQSPCSRRKAIMKIRDAWRGLERRLGSGGRTDEPPAASRRPRVSDDRLASRAAAGSTDHEANRPASAAQLGPRRSLHSLAASRPSGETAPRPFDAAGIERTPSDEAAAWGLEAEAALLGVPVPEVDAARAAGSGIGPQAWEPDIQVQYSVPSRPNLSEQGEPRVRHFSQLPHVVHDLVAQHMPPSQALAVSVALEGAQGPGGEALLGEVLHPYARRPAMRSEGRELADGIFALHPNFPAAIETLRSQIQADGSSLTLAHALERMTEHLSAPTIDEAGPSRLELWQAFTHAIDGLRPEHRVGPLDAAIGQFEALASAIAEGGTMDLRPADILRLHEPLLASIRQLSTQADVQEELTRKVRRQACGSATRVMGVLSVEFDEVASIVRELSLLKPSQQGESQVLGALACSVADQHDWSVNNPETTQRVADLMALLVRALASDPARPDRQPPGLLDAYECVVAMQAAMTKPQLVRITGLLLRRVETGGAQEGVATVLSGLAAVAANLLGWDEDLDWIGGLLGKTVGLSLEDEASDEAWRSMSAADRSAHVNAAMEPVRNLINEWAGASARSDDDAPRRVQVALEWALDLSPEERNRMNLPPTGTPGSANRILAFAVLRGVVRDGLLDRLVDKALSSPPELRTDALCALTAALQGRTRDFQRHAVLERIFAAEQAGGENAAALGAAGWYEVYRTLVRSTSAEQTRSWAALLGRATQSMFEHQGHWLALARHTPFGDDTMREDPERSSAAAQALARAVMARPHAVPAVWRAGAIAFAVEASEHAPDPSAAKLAILRRLANDRRWVVGMNAGQQGDVTTWALLRCLPAHLEAVCDVLMGLPQIPPSAREDIVICAVPPSQQPVLAPLLRWILDGPAPIDALDRTRLEGLARFIDEANPRETDERELTRQLRQGLENAVTHSPRYVLGVPIDPETLSSSLARRLRGLASDSSLDAQSMLRAALQAEFADRLSARVTTNEIETIAGHLANLPTLTFANAAGLIDALSHPRLQRVTSSRSFFDCFSDLLPTTNSRQFTRDQRMHLLNGVTTVFANSNGDRRLAEALSVALLTVDSPEELGDRLSMVASQAPHLGPNHQWQLLGEMAVAIEQISPDADGLKLIIAAAEDWMEAFGAQWAPTPPAVVDDSEDSLEDRPAAPVPARLVAQQPLEWIPGLILRAPQGSLQAVADAAAAGQWSARTRRFVVQAALECWLGQEDRHDQASRDTTLRTIGAAARTLPGAEQQEFYQVLFRRIDDLPVDLGVRVLKALDQRHGGRPS